MVNETAFSFEISEILYLHENHALKEMIELSLEPNVNLTKQNEEVNLKGSLRLLGKYIQSSEELKQDQIEFNPSESRKILEDINESADHSSFTHDFPVNIFVPAYRLKEGAKTEVSIAAFDYEIINPVTLRFIATVEISGFLPEEKVREIEKVENVETDNPRELSFQEEMRSEEVKQAIEPKNETKKKLEPVPDQKSRQGQVPEQKKMNKPENKKQDSKGKMKETQIRAEQTKQEPVEEMNDANSDRSDLNYLTNLFDTDEGKQAKLQICIVQEQDTLDSISERFAIKKSQLMKQNNLEDETIKSGEILFISLH